MLENMIGTFSSVLRPLIQICEVALSQIQQQGRIDLLRAFVRHNEEDKENRDAILYCVSCYDICTENRNILMHSTYFDTGKAVKLVKRKKKTPHGELHFSVPLTDLRRLADEIASVFVYAVGVFRRSVIRNGRGFPHF